MLTRLIRLYFFLKSNQSPSQDRKLSCGISVSGNFFSSFLKYKFIYFNWRLITLKYCIGFPNINMNPPQVYTCSPSWTPLPPLSLYHPSGSSQCTSPKHLYHALNLDWQFISYMILYMFQCHSPKSYHPHPLPLPQSPKDCFIHLCLFCLLNSVINSEKLPYFG